MHPVHITKELINDKLKWTLKYEVLAITIDEFNNGWNFTIQSLLVSTVPN